LIQQRKKGGGFPPPDNSGRHLHLGLDVNRQVQTGERIEDAVQGLAPLGQGNQVALVNLGEAIVQAPQVARREFFVRGLLPLVEHIGNHRLANRPRPIAAENEVARFVIRQGRLGVLRHARFVLRPHIAQRANRARNDLRQVAQEVRRMAATENNLVVENEVAANERSVARADASGETLIVRIAEADNGARRASFAHIDFEQAEVTLAEAGGGVNLLLDREARGLHLIAEDANEVSVRDRLVRIRLAGRINFEEISAADLGIVGTANAEVDGIGIHSI